MTGLIIFDRTDETTALGVGATRNGQRAVDYVAVGNAYIVIDCLRQNTHCAACDKYRNLGTADGEILHLGKRVLLIACFTLLNATEERLGEAADGEAAAVVVAAEGGAGTNGCHRA